MIGLVRGVIFLLLGGIILLIGATIVVGALALTGDPAACVDREISVVQAESQALKAAWRTFGAETARGNATIRLTEVQATSRGVEFIEDEDIPLDSLQVYFCPDGVAEASGEVRVLGLVAKIVVRGTMELEGEKPRIRIDDVRAGNVPGFLAEALVDLVISEGNRRLDIDENLTGITFADGTATVSGGP